MGKVCATMSWENADAFMDMLENDVRRFRRWNATYQVLKNGLWDGG
jgi:hypothetical protein